MVIFSSNIQVPENRDECLGLNSQDSQTLSKDKSLALINSLDKSLKDPKTTKVAFGCKVNESCFLLFEEFLKMHNKRSYVVAALDHEPLPELKNGNTQLKIDLPSLNWQTLSTLKFEYQFEGKLDDLFQKHAESTTGIKRIVICSVAPTGYHTHFALCLHKPAENEPGQFLYGFDCEMPPVDVLEAGMEFTGTQEDITASNTQCVSVDGTSMNSLEGSAGTVDSQESC